jgi:hypothetical protein
VLPNFNENESLREIYARSMNLPIDPNKLRFSVLPGNNSRLIRIAMERRKDFWLETTN